MGGSRGCFVGSALVSFPFRSSSPFKAFDLWFLSDLLRFADFFSFRFIDATLMALGFFVVPVCFVCGCTVHCFFLFRIVCVVVLLCLEIGWTGDLALF